MKYFCCLYSINSKNNFELFPNIKIRNKYRNNDVVTLKFTLLNLGYCNVYNKFQTNNKNMPKISRKTSTFTSIVIFSSGVSKTQDLRAGVHHALA